MPNNSLRGGRRAVNTRCNTPALRRRRRSPPPALVVVIGSERLEVGQLNLSDPEFVTGLQERCAAAQTNPQFEIHDILAWPDEHRSAFIGLVAGMGRSYRVRVRDEEFDDLFNAMLHIAEGPADIGRCTRATRAALEAAAAVHPQALEAACSRIAKRFRELEVRGLLPQSLLRTARNLVGQQSTGGGVNPTVAAAEFLDYLRGRRPAGDDNNGAGGDNDELMRAGDDELMRVGSDEEDDAPVLRYFQDTFYVWEPPIWKELRDEAFRASVVRFLQAESRCESVSDRFVRDVVTNLKGMALFGNWNSQLPLRVTSEEPLVCEPSPYVVFQNGMVNLNEAREMCSTVPLVPADSSNFATVVLPYDFDPDATCPLWIETLDEIFPTRHDEDHRILVLQEFMGWSLFPHDTGFEKYLALFGKGANGKSTICNVATYLLGEENVSHVPLDRLSGEFRLHQMIGKMANIAADMNRMDKVEEGMLKTLTSGDKIQVNRKNKPVVTMRPTAKLIFGTNTLPPINDRSDGIWRREIAMPCLQRFPEGEADLRRSERLRAELSGIFNWALDGARRLYRQGRFTRCYVCERALYDHRYCSDPFLQFIAEKAYLRAGVTVKTQILYDAYAVWCEANGRSPKGSSDFGKQVLDLAGVTKQRQGNGQRVRQYVGIGLYDPVSAQVRARQRAERAHTRNRRNE